MSSISGIGGLWQQSTAQTSSKTADAYSQLVEKLQSGGGDGSGADSGEDKVTVQRFLPDGSVLILVMQGDQVVSETKYSPAQQRAMHMAPVGGSESAAALAGTVSQQVTDRFNDTSTSILAGSLFNEGV